MIMALRETELEMAVRELVEERRRELGKAPTSYELLAYHQGELPPEEAERIQEFLAHNPDSARDLIDRVAFQETGLDSSDDLTEEEKRKDWEALQRRLAPAPSRPRAGTLYAVAASILVVLLGAWSFTLVLRTQEPEQPQVNVRQRDLLPDGRRGSTVEEPIRLNPESNHFLLRLLLVDERKFPDYRLEIVESDEPERVLWTETGLQRFTGDIFTLRIARGFLPSGRYSLKLYGIDAGDAQLLASYTVQF